MRPFLLRSLASLVLFIAPMPARAAEAATWEPAKTWVFAVGILRWEHPEIWASFPNAVKNRRDQQLVEHFRKKGVPDRQIVCLKDEKATLANIHKQFTAMLA